MEFKEKTATEALEKIANAPLEHHWGCDQILIHGLHFSMDDVQAYAKATLNNQPKLSIPKKIADKLDEFYTLKFFDLGEADHWLQENDITSWKCETDSKTRFALVDAYLAGKEFGVELVEVEG